MEDEKLPVDLIYQILLRLPAKTLIRFKTVCKSWHSLISSPDFVIQHFAIGKHHKLLLQSADSFCFVNCDDHSEGQMEKNQLDFIRNDETLNDVLFSSCNGLLCLMFKNGSFVLWTPSTREYKHVPLCKKVGVDFKYSFGFGYDHVNNDFQIVRLVHPKHAPSREITHLDMYSLKSNSWKELCAISWNLMFVRWYLSNTTCMFLDGKYYWIVKFLSKWKEARDGVQVRRGDGFREEIMCFDSNSGQLGFVKLPSEVSNKNYPFIDLGVIRGCLSLFDCHGWAIDIWTIMSSEEQETSWTKFTTTPKFIEAYAAPVCSLDSGEILLRVYKESRYKFYVFSPEENLFNPEEKREFDDQERCFDNVIFYTESLLSLGAIGGTGSLALERRGVTSKVSRIIKKILTFFTRMGRT